MTLAPAAPIPALSASTFTDPNRRNAMKSAPLLAWVRAYDGRREIWPVGQYLAFLDLTPEAAQRTAARLNWFVERVAAYDRVHSDPSFYEIELIDHATNESLFRWIYTPLEGP